MKNFLLNNSHRLLALVVLIFLVISVSGSLMLNDPKNTGSVYHLIAFNIIMLWLCIFTVYFVWALRFYNINFGLTKAEWEQIELAKEQRRKGLTYNEQDIADEPQENPYKSETFGLPNGTVRGMIAFTLLFGAVALLIASMAPQNPQNPNTLLVDQFDFFKTAFLMMIAFYFGSRSLEFLKGKTGVTTAPVATPQTPTEELATQTPETEKTGETSPADAPKIKVSVAGNISTVPMITQVKDPMSFNEQ